MWNTNLHLLIFLSDPAIWSKNCFCHMSWRIKMWLIMINHLVIVCAHSCHSVWPVTSNCLSHPHLSSCSSASLKPPTQLLVFQLMTAVQSGLTTNIPEIITKYNFSRPKINVILKQYRALILYFGSDICSAIKTLVKGRGLIGNDCIFIY